MLALLRHFEYLNLDPHLTHGSLDQLSEYPERHHDKFSRFAGLTAVTDQQTDHATPSVAIGRMKLVMRCGLTTSTFRDCSDAASTTRTVASFYLRSLVATATPGQAQTINQHPRQIGTAGFPTLNDQV